MRLVISARHTSLVCFSKVEAVAVQLMEVVYGVHENGWLVKLLRGMIFGTGTGEKHKKVRLQGMTRRYFFVFARRDCNIFPCIVFYHSDFLLSETPNLIRANTPVREDSENRFERKHRTGIRRSLSQGSHECDRVVRIYLGEALSGVVCVFVIC